MIARASRFHERRVKRPGFPGEPTVYVNQPSSRGRVISVFPNPASALRLLGACLMELDEYWTTGKRHFSMWGYWDWKEPAAPQQHVAG